MKHTITSLPALLLAITSTTASPMPQSNSGISCKPFTVFFARGTTEPGTLGFVVGPNLQTSVQQALGANKVGVTGISYPADASGITAEVTGSGPGSVAMAAQAQAYLSQCPQSKIVLSGYSQGAMVVHNAAAKLASQIKSVVACVTFGDPDKAVLPAGIPTAEFRSFCGAGDSVCSAGGCADSAKCASQGSGHTGYGADISTATAFIKAACLKAGGSTGGSQSTSPQADIPLVVASPTPTSGSSATGTGAASPAASTPASTSGASGGLFGLPSLEGFPFKLPSFWS